MNFDWKTTLLSKGLELNRRFKWTSLLSQGLEKKLEERGLRLNAVDFAAFVERWAPRSSRQILGYMLNFLRPAVLGIGLRISHLSDEKIEMLIPAQVKNKNEEGFLHEAVMVTAAVEAAKTLWYRHAPLGGFHIQVQNVNFKNLKNQLTRNSDVRLRMEISESVLESTLGQLRVINQSFVENHLQFFIDRDQLVAEATVHLLLSTQALLESALDPGPTQRHPQKPEQREDQKKE